jgi:DNA-binding CsgD family transcriptional regulator
MTAKYGAGAAAMTKAKNSPRTARERNTPRAEGFSEGLLLVDMALCPIALDPGAVAILRDINGETRPPDHLPQEITALLNLGDTRNSARTSVRLNTGKHEYTCCVFTLEAKTKGGAPIMAVYLKRLVSLQEAVHLAGADYHLTDREQETLIGVTMGLTSKELATRMNISPNTVKAFLRLLMIKMGVPTRAGIVGKLVDQNSRGEGFGKQKVDNHLGIASAAEAGGEPDRGPLAG